MTPYQERREAGHYDAPAAVEAPEPEPAPEPAPPDDEEDNGGELSLAELKAIAESQGLPTYGTKAQLRERLEEAQTVSA